MNRSAHVINQHSKKRELTLQDGVVRIIGRGILSSVTDTRCSRHHAQLSFNQLTNDAQLTVTGAAPVAVKKKDAEKPIILQDEQTISITPGDWFALLPETNVKYELLILNDNEPTATTTTTGVKKTNSNNEIPTKKTTNISSNSNNTTTTTTTTTSEKRKRDMEDNENSTDIKHPKHKHTTTSVGSNSSDDESGGDNVITTNHKSKTHKKMKCMYGEACYRKNAEHLAKFSHSPVDAEASSGDDHEQRHTKAIPIEEKKTKLKTTILPITEDKDTFADDTDIPPKQQENVKKTAEAVHKDEDNEDPEEEKGGDNSGEGNGDCGDEENPVKPKNLMVEGQIYHIQGSSDIYRIKLVCGVYSCTCHAWKNQSLPIGMRTCKHLREYLGDEYEKWRLKRPLNEIPIAQKKGAPNLLLAHKWEPQVDPKGWWMSEKLDGVRAYWDGSSFISRLGNVYPAPDWFTEKLPKDLPLDGELWCGRKMFQKCVSIVKTKEINDQWKKVTYQVFDAPSLLKPVEERFEHVKKYFKQNPSDWVNVVKMQLCEGLKHLQDELKVVEELGGEGLMLRKPQSMYVGSRSTTLLKVKTFCDEEAIVTGHEPGKGKYKGKVGALMCELASGVQFCVGSGYVFNGNNCIE